LLKEPLDVSHASPHVLLAFNEYRSAGLADGCCGTEIESAGNKSRSKSAASQGH
jgi:hypothetical protein